MTDETRVGHTRYDDCDIYAGRGARSDLSQTEVGERGWLGNPFTTETFGREQAIALYRQTFENRLETDPEFEAAVRELAGQTLGCWCQRLDHDAPACHAEVIAEHADRLAREDHGLQEVADA